MTSPVPDAAAIAGLLADDTRRRVVAALVLGASTVDEVRSATGLGTRAVATALGRLVDGELVVRGDDGSHHVIGEAFRAAAAAARPAPSDEADDAPPEVAKVLRAYFRDGRLVRVPTQRAKKLVVLDRLAQGFEPGVHYPERAVNAELRRYHPDVAALRRYLVDEGFLDRDHGQYWRSGGTVEGR